MKNFYVEPEIVMIDVEKTHILTMTSGLSCELEELEFDQFVFD